MILLNVDKKRLFRVGKFAAVAFVAVYLLWQGAMYNGPVLGEQQSTSSTVSKVDKSSVSKGSSNSIKETDPETGLTYMYADYESTYNGPKVKATFVSLVRNSDLWDMVGSIKSVEDRFNSKFQYDWVFLNDEEFTDEFVSIVTNLVSGEAKFGLVPKEHWSYPEWIDQEKAARTREEMREKQIIYGHSESYRHMCRFESGFFYRNELMAGYEYYWRVEPSVKFSCDINYDIFRFMKDNGKKYGFTMSLREYESTIETLWSTTKEFLDANPETLHANNMMDYISDDDGEHYNLCHFWSNFEVAALDFWNGDAYSKYFDHLDRAGGFFYERWGDAPVHTIAAALFLDRKEVHHFADISYYHVPFNSCPVDEKTRQKNKCSCNPNDDFTWKSYSCTTKFYNANNIKKPDGWQNFT